MWPNHPFSLRNKAKKKQWGVEVGSDSERKWKKFEKRRVGNIEEGVFIKQGG